MTANDKTILGVMGHLHSEAWPVTERFPRRDFGHLDYEVNFNDPKCIPSSSQVRILHELLANSDIFERYPKRKDCAHVENSKGAQK